MSLLPSGKRFPTSEKSGTSFSTGSPARKPANGSGSLVTSDRILTRKEELRESMSQNPSPLPSLSPVQVPRPVLTSSNSGDSPPPRSEPVASVALPDLATMTTTPSPDVSKLSSFLTKPAGIPKDVMPAGVSPQQGQAVRRDQPAERVREESPHESAERPERIASDSPSKACFQAREEDPRFHSQIASSGQTPAGR